MDEVQVRWSKVYGLCYLAHINNHHIQYMIDEIDTSILHTHMHCESVSSYHTLVSAKTEGPIASPRGKAHRRG